MVIHNHFHKCGVSCFKKGHRSKSGVTICRFGCLHYEKVAVEDEKGKTALQYCKKAPDCEAKIEAAASKANGGGGKKKK